MALINPDLLDEHGYLKDWQQWTTALAIAFAKLEQLTLQDDHWQVIHALRDFYQTYEYIPILRLVIKMLADKIGPSVASSVKLHCLFPGGVLKQACRLAGLPKPPHCM